jgi:cytoplasmic tRNA 2-thiolation protein 2
MQDRTAEVAKFIQESYPTFHLVSIRLSNAFDKQWWEAIRGTPLTKPHFATQLDPGALWRPVTTVLTLMAFLTDLTFRILDNPSSTPLESLQTYFRSLPTRTAVHSSIQTLIRVLLLHIVQSTNSSHLLLGTSLTSLAISLISGISQGGGYNVREEAQEDWTPPPTSKDEKERTFRLVRPLRDVSVKECGAYAWWRGLKVIGKDNWPGGRQSIGGLTKGTSAEDVLDRVLSFHRLGSLQSLSWD